MAPVKLFDNLFYFGYNTIGAWAIPTSDGIILIDALNNQKDAEEIIKTAEDIAAREALMTKDVRAGKPITEVMGINYEQMLHK